MKDKEGFVRLQGILFWIYLVPKVLCFNLVLCYVGKDFFGGHELLQASSTVAGKHENVGTANELTTY
jgi:hypothetical protein